MKSGTRFSESRKELSASSWKALASFASPFSAHTKIVSGHQKTALQSQTKEEIKSLAGVRVTYLSKSMAKTFQRMKERPKARDAYVRAEVATYLAHQIRHIRMHRNWTQSELAKKLGTTQANISRLEDPTYGRISLSTLFDLANVFESGLSVRFTSMVEMLKVTFHPKAADRDVLSFTEEAAFVVINEAPQTSIDVAKINFDKEEFPPLSWFSHIPIDSSVNVGDIRVFETWKTFITPMEQMK